MYNIINSLKWKKDMVKTMIWYRMWLGKIGRKSTICKPLRLNGTNYMYLGNHVRIRENARIEAIDRYNEQRFSPELIIGDHTGFEQGLHLTCAGKLEIGKNVTVNAYVMITDIYHEYKQIKENTLNQPLGVKNTIIGDYCMIGLGSRILPGAVLGNNCIVGINAVVTEGIYDDYSVLVGAPAYVVKRYDTLEKRWRRTDRKGQFII